MNYLRRLVILFGLSEPTLDEAVALGWKQNDSALSLQSQINIATEEALYASFDLIRLQKEIYDDMVSAVAEMGLQVEVREEYQARLSVNIARIRAAVKVAEESFNITEEELLP